MPRKPVKKLPPLTAWQATGFRLTAFPSPAADFEGTTWWTDVVGTEPERRISKPKMSQQQDEGPSCDGNLILNVQPSRIDWLLQPPREELEQISFPSIGSFPEVLDSYVKLMISWLASPTCPPLIRLAFGAILIQPTQDRAEAYKRLGPYLHYVEIDPKASSDFFYQINRPRKSRTGISSLLSFSSLQIPDPGFPIGQGGIVRD